MTYLLVDSDSVTLPVVLLLARGRGYERHT